MSSATHHARSSDHHYEEISHIPDALEYTMKNVDGVRKISELIASILDVIAEAFEKLRASCQQFIGKIRNFTDLTTCISIVKRIREWTTPDYDGNMLWEQQWQSLPSTAAVTVSNVFDFLALLEGFAAISLGAASAPLALISTILTVISYSLDSWMYADSAKDYASSANKAEQTAKEWTKWKQKIESCKRLPKTWHKHVQEKINKWQDRLRNEQVAKNDDGIETAKEKIRQWEVLKKETVEKVLETCKSKIAKNAETQRSNNVDKSKYWIYVVSCVASIVLTILSYAQPYLTGGLLLTLLLLYVANNALDLASYVLDSVWN